MEDKDLFGTYEEYVQAFQNFLDNPNHTQEDCNLLSALYSTIINLVTTNVALDFEIRLLERELRIAEEAIVRERNKKKEVIH